MLCKSDIERERTPSELREWYEKTEKKLTSTKEDKHLFRTNVGNYVKEFREEIYPALLYIETRYGKDSQVRYRPAIGTQSFDGEVFKPDGEQVEYVECTLAVGDDGHQEHLRIQALNRYGHVDAVSKPIDPGTKKDNRPHLRFPKVSVDSGSIVERLSGLLAAAIQKKSKKNYTRKYTLLVAVDDGLLISNDECYFDELLSSARNIASTCDGDFASVWLVSLARQQAELDPIAWRLDSPKMPLP